MTTDEAAVRAEAEQVAMASAPSGCAHIWNSHGSCQWCNRERFAVFAGNVARAYLAAHAHAPAPATPAAGERFAQQEKPSAAWVVYRWGPDGRGGLMPHVLTDGLSQADAELLAHGAARLAALEADNRRLRELLLEFAVTKDFGDGLPCFCRYRIDGEEMRHSARCGKARAALAEGGT